MSTLILSVHVPHANSSHWRRLQAKFVAETVGDYEYGVIVNGDNPTLYKNVILAIPEKTSHLRAITLALNIFAQHRHRFSHFLLLDSDCWPVRPDWQPILNRLMGDQYHYAAPMRIENFDNFPHPSAFYMKAGFLEQADFDFNRAANALGTKVSDVGAAMPQIISGQQVWYPLLKTNYVSPHPVYASIYGDLFYHHCAGSRGIGFRGAGCRFYDHIISRKAHRLIYEEATTELLKTPRLYIDRLRGVKFKLR